MTQVSMVQPLATARPWLTRALLRTCTYGLFVSFFVSPPCFAEFDFIQDEAAFFAAFGQFDTETFENASVTDGSTEPFDGPLNSLTNNSVFSPGDVLDGIEILTSRGGIQNPNTSLLLALGQSVAGFSSKSIGISQMAINTDEINIVFDTPQTVTGFNYSSIDPATGEFLRATILLDIYADASDEDSRVGGAFGNVESASPMSFAGFASTIPFTRIRIISLTAFSSPVIDNLAFNERSAIAVAVSIDIKPGGDLNSINCNNDNGVITVTILTTDNFDATTVDHSTVTFEGASETHVDRRSGEPRRHEEDVDGDGDIDLVFHFRLGDTDLTCDSTEGTLTGETFDGQSVEGNDSVNMIGS